MLGRFELGVFCLDFCVYLQRRLNYIAIYVLGMTYIP